VTKKLSVFISGGDGEYRVGLSALGEHAKKVIEIEKEKCEDI
jgi:hypothetical protein